MFSIVTTEGTSTTLSTILSTIFSTSTIIGLQLEEAQFEVPQNPGLNGPATHLVLPTGADRHHRGG